MISRFDALASDLANGRGPIAAEVALLLDEYIKSIERNLFLNHMVNSLDKQLRESEFRIRELEAVLEKMRNPVQWTSTAAP